MTYDNNQLGFDALLAETDATNEANAFAKETAHLPDTMEEAVQFHAEQIITHHAAVLECDFDKAIAIREEACLLAKKLNGGKNGILAHDHSPGCVLARECAAKTAIPLWGQDGEFTVSINGIEIIIKMNGMFGIGGRYMTYQSFGASVADTTKPFLSDTGYRSFLGCSVEPEKYMTPDGFAKRILDRYIAHDLKGKLVSVSPRFRKSR